MGGASEKNNAIDWTSVGKKQRKRIYRKKKKKKE